MSVDIDIIQVIRIYVGFDSPSIIRYVIPSVGTFQRARFQNCQFVETQYPPVETPKPSLGLDFWAQKMFTLNPYPSKYFR